MAKILVIDDEPDVLRAVRLVLDLDSHQTHIMSDAKQAVRLIAEGEYDLAIVDLLMPVMNGPQVLEQVKHARPDFPVILLSGSADLFDIDRLMALGAAALVEKPFEPQRLLEVVRKTLSQPRS